MKIKIIIFLLVSCSIYANTPTADEFLAVLKTNQSKIKTLTADIVWTIEGAGEVKMVQKGKYYADNEKGLVKLEFIQPVYQALLIKGTEIYIKSATSADYKKVEINNTQIPSYQNSFDLFQYNFLKQYNYKLEKSNEDSGIFQFDGYKDSAKQIEVIYDNNLKIIKQYTIIGNETMPYIVVSMEYENKKISQTEEILLPVRIMSRTKAGITTVTGIVEMLNIKLNGEIDSSIFTK